jgi:transcriptional regulator of heat shock response
VISPARPTEPPRTSSLHCAVEFQAFPSRIGQIRRILTAQLRYWRLPQLIDSVTLGITELLSNIHRHGAADKHCTVELVLLETSMAELARVLLDTVVARPDERIAVAGAANLTRHQAYFAGSLRSIMEALEEEVVLMQLLGRTDSGALLTVRIGDENELDDFRETSVVSAGYGPGSVVGHMGVLGPTRMDYPGTIAAVRAVARYVSEILEQNR